ncbi:trigger factor, partial [Pseudoalteromonas sp. S2721]
TKALPACKELEFDATLELYQEHQKQCLEKIAVEKPAVSLTDEHLANMLETLRKQHASWAEVDAAAGENDRVTIDFVG